VQTWVNGVEDAEFVGVGARFGRTIVSKEKNARQTRLVLSDPRDCCSPPMNKVLSFFMYECYFVVYFDFITRCGRVLNVTSSTVSYNETARLLEMSSWWIEATANSQKRQILRKMLMLRLSSS